MAAGAGTRTRTRILLIAAALALMLPGLMPSAGEVGMARGDTPVAVAESFRLHEEPYYFEAVQSWEQRTGDARDTIAVAASAYAAASEDAELRAGPYGGKPDALVWTRASGWVEYEVDVRQAGLYALELEYYPLQDERGARRGAVTIGLEINGEIPFREARSLTFEREFTDAWPLLQDLDGNDIRPKTQEREGWKRKAAQDSEGAYPLPLKWNLREGTNKIRLYLLQEPAAFGELTLRPPETLPDYEAYRRSFPESVVQPESDVVIVEAERMARKNATSIQLRYDRDAATTPQSQSRITYNSVGGWRWFEGGESATWTFAVPETGWYRIALRVKQNYRSNMAVFRTIAIDGSIPFAELAAYKFPYGDAWQGLMLGGEDEPYAFYLERGEHELTMTASHALYRNTLAQLEDVSARLHDISGMLDAATGGANDEFRVWRVDVEIPGLTERLGQAKSMLDAMTEAMLAVNGKKDHVSQTLESASGSIRSLLERPNTIPQRRDQLVSLREAIESLHSFLVDSPLLIDKFYIVPEGGELPRMTAGWFQRLLASVETFFSSFAARGRLDERKGDVLNVWMMWGRDHVNELQLLANERFTPEHGVRVNVNLVQQPDLLVLAGAADILPDVALGVPGSMPYDLALRGAAMNLLELPGAEERIASYHPGSLLPFRHEEGVYALPETMQFKVLFYRKDILAALGLAVPDTWDDVYAMLPTLLQNRYNFFVDPKDFATIFYQRGVELYEADGLGNALHRPEAYDAFRAWTDLFQVYGLEKSVQSFYNQFRRGTLPIGIADFNQFLQLTVAAPELRGLWDIAPIPGIASDAGVVERWSGGVSESAPAAGGGMTSIMMFRDADPRKRDLSWAFVKWYTSTEIQTEFGLNLESFNGEQFRWNTANVEAFARMPWKPEQLDVLLEQWKWYKDLPLVPGGYMTARELHFAWIRTVLDGESPRTALEDAAREIDLELTRKQLEFGFAASNGTPLKPLRVPVVHEPWMGVADVAK